LTKVFDPGFHYSRVALFVRLLDNGNELFTTATRNHRRLCTAPIEHEHITIYILHIMSHPDLVTINHSELLARIFNVIRCEFQSQVNYVSKSSPADRKSTAESMRIESNYDQRGKIMIGFRPPFRKSGEIFLLHARNNGWVMDGMCSAQNFIQLSLWSSVRGGIAISL
jgi:hypothetical protein